MNQRKLVAGVATALLNPLFATLRYKVEGVEHEQRARATGPCIYALWHGRLLPLSYYHRGQNVATLISRSADGDYLACFLEHWGFVPVRGSSSRGGMEAVRQLVRMARKGHSIAITPDGPRGPMQELKPGVLLTAQLAGLPIVPATVGASSAWWPGKWDRFLIPRPFAEMRVRYGAPMRVPRGATEPDLEKLRVELQDRLNIMTAEVDAL